jgi:DNA-binding CsgD family transcriptional regulator
MMSLDERVHGVIQSLYDAAMDEAVWPEALKKLTDVTGSQVASFWVLDSSEKPRLLVRHPDKPIVHDGLVITELGKTRHPSYDWRRDYSVSHFRMVGQVHPAPTVQAGVAIHRRREAGRYKPVDIERFTIVHRHLERALRIGSRLGSLGAIQQCTTKLLDGNAAAVLFLDEHKHIVYANRSAQALYSGDDGIRLSSAGIAALRQQDNDRLQCLITQALSGIALPDASPGGATRVLRPSGKRPYGVVVAPVSGRHPALSTLRPSVCIVITDPDGKRPLPHHSLRGIFGLTEAEARLAALLAGGEELRSAAAQLKITYGTARSRLTGIFQKTETRRQAELIKLLLITLTT